MPRGSKRRLEVDEDGEAEYSQPSQLSQPSQPSQFSRAASSSSSSDAAAAAAAAADADAFALTKKDLNALAKVPPHELPKIVAEVVRHCLLCHSSKKPIRFARLSADVFRGKYKGAGGALLKRAQVELKRLFGYELVVAPTKASARAAASAGSASSRDYMLIHSSNDANQIAKLNKLDTNNSTAQRGLFMLIGAVLFMHEGKILETDLWHCLEELGFEGCHAAPLGDLKHAVKDVLCPQGYLVREKAIEQAGVAPGSANDDAYVIKLGPRGHVETNTQSTTSSEAMYTFACTVMDQEPDPAQLVLYRREEEQRAEGARRGEEALKNLPTDGSERASKGKSKARGDADGVEKQKRSRKSGGRKSKGKSSRRGKEEAEDDDEAAADEAPEEEDDDEGGGSQRRASSQKR